MTQSECDNFLEAVLNIGRAMVQSGAEIWRVEDALSRIFKSYQIPRAEIYTTTTLLIATIKTGDIIATQSVRIYKGVNNLGALEKLNHLSRTICSQTPPTEQIQEMTAQAVRTVKKGGYHFIGYTMAAAAFTVFFGGDMADSIVAGVIAAIVFVIEKYLNIKETNTLIYTLIMNFMNGSLAILAVGLGLGQNVDKVIIGIVMLFIPALALVNGIKDMFYRDIHSGIFRVIEAVLIAAAIALGIGLAMILWGGML